MVAQLVLWTDFVNAPVSRRLEHLEELANMVRCGHPLVLRAFAPSSAISELQSEVLDIPCRRVTATEEGDDQWDEYKLLDQTNLWHIMTCRTIEALIESALVCRVTSRVGWVNVYMQNERIGWHRDTEGGLQLLLCLEKPASGGVFMTSSNDRVSTIDLNPGDAFLFDATRIPHATTPVESALDRRIVAVVRFYK